MKKTTDSSTLHNPLVKGSQENLQENVTGANSLPTQAPTEFDKSVIVQSSPASFSASQLFNSKVCKYVKYFIKLFKSLIGVPCIKISWKSMKYDYTLPMIRAWKKEMINKIVAKYKGKTLDEIAKAEKVPYFSVDLNESKEYEVSWVIMYNKENDRFVIFINESDSDNRKRFTLAHELGHFFLHWEDIKWEMTVDDTSHMWIDKSENFRFRSKVVTKWSDEEQEANLFAAELLMPEDAIREAWEVTQDLTKLSEIFSVSITAITYRLINIWLLNT